MQRQNNLKDGTRIFHLPFTQGVARFAVEFLRLNQRLSLLTQAQLVAICFI
jgi:prolipoprotein diacylglyceryltransferase